METDKSIVEEHKEQATVVFDDSMKGKKIDDIGGKLGVDFADEGRTIAPIGRQNLLVGDHKWCTPTYRKRYDEIAWGCDRCGKMHPKGEKCK